MGQQSAPGQAGEITRSRGSNPAVPEGLLAARDSSGEKSGVSEIVLRDHVNGKSRHTRFHEVGQGGKVRQGRRAERRSLVSVESRRE